MNPPSTPQIKEPPRVGVAADLPENRRGAAGFIAEDCGGESLFFCDGTAVDYPYDPIGNRIHATEGSTLYDYEANELNQYTTIDVGGTIDTPTYDDDGNMTNMDGVVYSYNGENRLVAVDDGTTRTEFVYDYMGRRVQKDVFVGGSLEATSAFVYDGWNMVEEIGGTDSEYYVWGLDLSQSLQGGGGVGGLIASVDGEANVFYFLFDGNGNVGQLVDGGDGSIAARYEYDAFGQTIVADGIEAADNPYRFSTKYTDETGLIYYGYRYYLPEVGRWLTCDPIEERGGLNLYGFVRNAPSDRIDFYGLAFNLRVIRTSHQFIRQQNPHTDAITTSAHGLDPRHGGRAYPRVIHSTSDVTTSNNTCCVRATRAKRIDVDVVTLLPNDVVGVLYTSDGLRDIEKHEARRVSAYRKAYRAYIKPVESRGRLVTHCGCKSKIDLLEYLEKNRRKAIRAFNSWVDRQQKLIGRERFAPPNNQGLLDTIMNPYTVPEPPRFVSEPCPARGAICKNRYDRLELDPNPYE